MIPYMWIKVPFFMELHPTTWEYPWLLPKEQGKLPIP